MASTEISSRGYPVAIVERPRRVTEFEPVRRPKELDRYVGQWVAVKGGRVIASATTSAELVKAVKALGEEGNDALAEYVAPPSQSWMVGVG